MEAALGPHWVNLVSVSEAEIGCLLWLDHSGMFELDPRRVELFSAHLCGLYISPSLALEVEEEVERVEVTVGSMSQWKPGP